MRFQVTHQHGLNNAQSPFRVVDQSGADVDWINRYLDQERVRGVSEVTRRSESRSPPVLPRRVTPDRVIAFHGIDPARWHTSPRRFRVPLAFGGKCVYQRIARSPSGHPNPGHPAWESPHRLKIQDIASIAANTDPWSFSNLQPLLFHEPLNGGLMEVRFFLPSRHFRRSIRPSLFSESAQQTARSAPSRVPVLLGASPIKGTAGARGLLTTNG